MNKLLFPVAAAILVFAACKKEETRTVLHTPTAAKGFAVTSNQVVLSTSNDSAMVTKFSWEAADYGYSAVVTYTLLFDVASDTSGAAGWANAVKVPIATDSLSKSWLGTDLNKVLNQAGLDPGVATPIVVRLKVDVNQSTGAASTVPALVSDLPMTVTPYHVKHVYPELYVAGDFLTPSWTPKEQGGWILASVLNDGSYEGYVNFPNTDNNFKLLAQPSWTGTAYGWGGSLTTMDPTSGGNLYFAGPGYCRVVANTKALTLAIDKMQFRITGDFNGWDMSATPMTFDPGTNLWTATGVSMTENDKFKFEGNTNWTAEFGLDKNGNFVFSGGNIIALKTGTFTVTLDLSQGAGNYTYSVK